MNLIEQYLPGIAEERLDRGVRAISWLLASVYVLTVRWWRPGDITIAIAIEASAVVGIVRAAYVLWIRYVSKHHRLYRLKDLIGKCAAFVRCGNAEDVEALVCMLILRDELAALRIGLPKTDGLLTALESLRSYSQEKRWDMAANVFHSDMYDYTTIDRLDAIAFVFGKQTGDPTDLRWINELRGYETVRAKMQRFKFVAALILSVVLAVVAVVTDELLFAYLFIGGSMVMGLTYNWARGRGFRFMFARATLEEAAQRRDRVQ
ncbi:hypothetical protein [Candidatus Palauibacter irciniicola]|uniref:hypothetical protein n=1 Tax=Candidatus Palauibacter irciniicola TaxID=3056733 RepID=UPI003B02EBE0